MKFNETENPELTTNPFDDQHKRQLDIHPALPNPPFSLMLVGPAGSGKSNLILRLLYGNKCKKNDKNKYGKFYRHFFDKVYIFSPSWKLDPKMNRCHIPEEQIFENPNLYHEIIEQLLGIQSDSIEEDGKSETPHILMVFSDLAGQKGVFSHGKGIMNKLAFNRRHFKVSIILDTQSIRQINPAFRSNLSGLILFSGITNRLELQKISDEYLGEFSSDEQQELIDYSFKEAYDFLYINFAKKGAAKFYHNFNPMNIEK